MKTKLHTKYRNKAEEIVPSVTQILKNLGWGTEALIAWARREAMAGNDPLKMRDKAGDIGTLAHYLIECHLTKQTPDTSEYAPAHVDKAENAFLAYLDWEKQHEIEVVASELKVVSEELQVGGTIDKVCKLDGKLTIVDFKTSSGVYAEAKIQVAAYAHIYDEVAGTFPPITEAHILRLGKEDGAFEHHLLADLEGPFRVFKMLREIHNYRGTL